MDRNTDIRKGRGPLDGFFEGGASQISAFGENRSAERAYTKAERLAAALYLLTAHIDPEEPLKWRVRSSALDMLDRLLAARDEMRAPNSQKLAMFRASLRKLLSMTRTLAVSGAISPQNARIIADALDELGAFLTTSRASALSESVPLGRDDLDAPESPIRSPRAGRSFTKDIKDNDGKSVRNMSDMSARRKSIMDILRAGGELAIRDIAANIPQYSEKTVQRELADLVRLGLVKKMGEKRWSRYALSRGE